MTEEQLQKDWQFIGKVIDALEKAGISYSDVEEYFKRKNLWDLPNW